MRADASGTLVDARPRATRVFAVREDPIIKIPLPSIAPSAH